MYICVQLRTNMALRNIQHTIAKYIPMCLSHIFKQPLSNTTLYYPNATYMSPHNTQLGSCAHSYEPRDPCQPLSTHHMYQLGHIRRGRRVMPTNPDSVNSSQLENSALRPTTGHLSYTDLSSLLFSVDHLPPKLGGHTIMTKMRERRSIICLFLVCA